ncbi:MAG: 16S rRNA (adenine(1518)-N(6)/adenine(1519)-N(6))-dimethyltransferase RsmA [Arenicellales bacterium]|nr:16S rRNA (adenine(1518)-N(6)/adenine(1519)-N(6))-dimethyltransferase RsmA [Arenicellales bacterium]
MAVPESPGPGRPRKRFGQHFLNDRVVIDRIMDSLCPRPGEALCEIGPGRGALTDRLAAGENELHLIEIDRDLVPMLRERYASQKEIQIHEQDALTLVLGDIHPDGHVVLVGNLPYNISTALMIHLLAQRNRIDRMVFMVQKEVAQRLTAPPGGKDYGRLTVMMSRVFETNLIFDVGPDAFTPPPKVWSSVVAFKPRPTPLGPKVAEDAFEALVRQAFSQRRKILRNTLKGICSESVILEAGLDPQARPEKVSVEDFARLVSLNEKGH